MTLRQVVVGQLSLFQFSTFFQRTTIDLIRKIDWKATLAAPHYPILLIQCKQDNVYQNVWGSSNQQARIRDSCM